MVRKVLCVAAVIGVLSGMVELVADTTLRSALHDYRLVTVVDALVQPWSIAFLPGGDMLITERPGRLRIVRQGKLLPQAVEGVPPVFHSGQGGLLEVMPHPNFASNRLLYISYSKPGADDTHSQNGAHPRPLRERRLTDVRAAVRGRLEGPRSLQRQDRVRQERLPVPDASAIGRCRRRVTSRRTRRRISRTITARSSGCTTTAACRPTIRS